MTAAMDEHARAYIVDRAQQLLADTDSVADDVAAWGQLGRLSWAASRLLDVVDDQRQAWNERETIREEVRQRLGIDEQPQRRHLHAAD